jgi:hypothetical protein
VNVVIVSAKRNRVIADFEWPGPLPVVGQFIARGMPRGSKPEPEDLMAVRSVTWMMLDVPDASGFCPLLAEPYAVVTV